MKFSKLILLGFAFIQIVGCAGVNTFSHSARTGDSVMVAVKHTEGANYIKKDDVTASVVDSDGVSHDVTVRSLYRLYADPTSQAMLAASTINRAYTGQWTALIDFIDPNTSVAPTMAEGDAALVLDHPTLTLHDPSVTILPGVGTPHDFINEYGVNGLFILNPQPHVIIKTNGTPSLPVVGATFTINFTNAANFQYKKPGVVKLSQDPNIQLMMNSKELSNGDMEIKVILINPYGFGATDFTDLNARQSLMRDLSFVLLWGDNQAAAPSENTWQQAISIVNSEFVDKQGNPITGLTSLIEEGRVYNNASN